MGVVYAFNILDTIITDFYHTVRFEIEKKQLKRKLNIEANIYSFYPNISLNYYFY